MLKRIDIPEDLAAEAQRSAAERGLSPAEFYAEAIRRALAREHRRHVTTEQINAVYDDMTEEEKHRDTPLLDAGLLHLEREDW